MARQTWNLVREAKRWFERAQEQYEYAFGMETLYQMCRKAPCHDDVKSTVSKLWLIGRSHSAALERRRDTSVFRPPYAITAKRLARETRFAALLEDVQSYQTTRSLYSPAHLASIHAVVSYLAMVFEQTTGMSKVSLASKYLHFHAPAVPIYDSITSSALRVLVRKRAVPDEAADLWKKGDLYARHVARFCAARKALRTAGFQVTARTLDIFLLYRNSRRASLVKSNSRND